MALLDDTLSQEEVRERFTYNPKTGEFFHKHRPRSMFSSDRDWKKWNTRYEGNLAGARSYYGYWRIIINRRHYMAHRIAWLWVHGEWPPEDIDHINGDRTDNRISNLRLATRSQNIMNSKRRRTNRSGVKGVRWIPARRKWRAEVGLEGDSHYIGEFDDLRAAEAAVMAARGELHGEFCRHE
ncbi:MAG: hypothetical protein FKY71_19880 [Spiribacter salinus]|uniref:HNH nuclease domain-containing protein n=1 Tax=Spiribacter salinus TaxID=1335746 RepID=A0A540V740_9GAMM|nr:MAG: hypothetical protein FKY71_19880 [Spiribacter salinus]